MVMAAMVMAIIRKSWKKWEWFFFLYFYVSDGFGGPLWVKKLPGYHIFYHANAQVMGRDADGYHERFKFCDFCHMPSFQPPPWELPPSLRPPVGSVANMGINFSSEILSDVAEVFHSLAHSFPLLGHYLTLFDPI